VFSFEPLKLSTGPLGPGLDTSRCASKVGFKRSSWLYYTQHSLCHESLIRLVQAGTTSHKKPYSTSGYMTLGIQYSHVLEMPSNA
jgi:hypothetical protein